MRRVAGFCFLMLLFIGSSQGQVPFFQHYFLLQKNEGVQVNKIFQDKSGFIWYATNKGLFRFDGVTQKRFTTVDSLPDINVTAIAQDSAGRIWVGHRNGLISFLEKNRFKKFEPAEGPASKEISDILFDRKGNLWFSSLGDGLYYYIQERLYRLDETEKMPDLFVYDITEDQEGKIWAGTDGGIAICQLENKNVKLKVLDYKNGLPDNIIRKIKSAEDGSIWMGTEDAGVIQYNPASGKFIPLFKDEWQSGTVTDFLLSDKQAWISTSQKGLLIYDRRTNKTEAYDAKTEIALASVRALLQDYEGNIWIGSKSGVARTPGDYLTFVDSPDPSKDLNVVTLAVDKEGNTWFSNSDGLFKRSVDNSGNAVIEQQVIDGPPKKHSVISLFVDGDGFVWAGLYGEGVVRINPLTGKMRHFEKELNDGNVLNISGKGNTVWLATLGGCSKIKTDGDNVTIKNFSANEGLISDFVYQVFTDTKGRVWFATDGKGVDMLDDAGFHHYSEGLKSKVIYGLAEDADHTIWANVQGDDLYKFDGRKFIASGANIPFRNSSINCLTSDQSGNLVLMHDLGIVIYNTRKNKFSFFGEELGVRDKVPNLNAVAKDSKGHILFGTNHGIIVYSDEFAKEQSAPLPCIEGLKVFNQDVDLSTGLRFRYNENDITIQYLGFWYQNPDNLSFQYTLENYDRGWITGRNRATNYSNLPPGEYTFRLRVSASDDFRDLKEASIHFIVRPPFWRTTWFYILSSVTSILLIFSFIKYRERKLRRDKKILEEKNAELKKTNMELDKFVYSVSHDLRTPLSGMLGIIEISEDETKDPLQLEHLGMLKGSIKKLDGFIHDILDYSRNSRAEVKKEEIDFRTMVTDITDNLKYLNGKNHPVEIKISVENPVPFRSDKVRMAVVLNNVISNAFRYQNPKSETPFVSVEVDTSGPQVSVIVRDNGIGISKENQQKIFNMFYRVSEQSVGSGLGLYIVKETVEKLQGQIFVESELGKGTEFRILIPKN